MRMRGVQVLGVSVSSYEMLSHLLLPNIYMLNMLLTVGVKHLIELYNVLRWNETRSMIKKP